MTLLAALRYRNVLKDKGGPIGSIVWKDVEELEGSGRSVEVIARLDLPHMVNGVPKQRLYCNADGVGTAKTRLSAAVRAVSECMERWAFFACISDPNAQKQYRFDIDPSTSGMAAYPLCNRIARTNALYEARERWSLREWWRGRLLQRLYMESIEEIRLEVQTPWPNTKMTIVSKKEPISGLWTYGFSARRSLRDAQAQSLCELERNLRVLRLVVGARTADEIDELIQSVEDLYEKRLLFFGGPGRDKFLERISESHCSRACAIEPKVLVDEEIMGPWTRYAHVWRVLYVPHSVPEMGPFDDFIF